MSKAIPPALLGRADLIRCLGAQGEAALTPLAELCGYEKKQHKLTVTSPQLSCHFTGTVNTPEAKLERLGSKSLASGQPVLFRVVKQESKTPRYRSGEKPKWFQAAKVLTDEDLSSQEARCAGPPLVRWPRLWPFLRVALGAAQATAHPDIERIVRQLAKGAILKHLPLQQRLGWAPRCRILIDGHLALLPFWDDFHDLLQALSKIRGGAGLEVFLFEQGPAGFCRDFFKPRARLRPYQHTSLYVPLLILSDLGCLTQSDERLGKWRRFGNKLSRLGSKPVALMPCPSRLWKKEVVRYFYPFVWDRMARYPRLLSSTTIPQPASGQAEKEAIKGVEKLLALIAPAILIEPPLLRAIRHLLPAIEADVGSEAEVWQHAAMTATPNMLYWRAKTERNAWRLSFQAQPELPRQAVAALVAQFHAWLSPALQHEEHTNYAELLGQPIPQVVVEFVQRVAKTLDDEGCKAGFVKWARRYLDRQHPTIWQQGDAGKTQLQAALKAVYLKAHETAYRQGKLHQLLEGLTDIGEAIWILKGESRPINYRLGQQGQQLCCLDVVEKNEKSTKLFKLASGLTEIIASHGLLECCQYSPANGVTSSGTINLAREQRELFVPNQGTSILLKSSYGSALIENFAKPSWATNVGRDQYGLYAELSYKGVVQRMRWLNPGRFMMGSPAGEAERRDAETQHEVTLTEGYWLADTPVIQPLWQAVMGKNPSRFKGAEKPVEQVSWEDAQQFILAMNRVNSDLMLRLPTEAEWEYGCRAGTQTPFSFGEKMTTDQVNYNSRYPYAGAAKGEYRQKTVEVKALPPNGWGLYQMHGNVWEWCADWFENYWSESVINPIGPKFGNYRVLRGGSWNNNGRTVRSAFRDYNTPSARYDYVGFRLARGPEDRSASR